jgi:hypothetical protein
MFSQQAGLKADHETLMPERRLIGRAKKDD